MEVGIEELLGSSSDDFSQIAKGKRTKRLRLQYPNGGDNTMMTCCSSSTAADAGDCGSFSSTATCNYEITEVEEDMANCLILLAQGDSQKQAAEEGGNNTEKFSSRRFANIATTSPACKTGIFVYECKTCNRAFPSFQALGGHRASHKKTKVDEKKSSPAATTLLSNDDHENLDSIKINTTSPPRTSVNSLLDGMDIVGILESQETSRTDCPLKPCRIVNCGELPLRELIYVFAVNIPLPIMAALLPLNLHLSSTMKIAVL